MSSQARFSTKSGNLSAKALKRILKDSGAVQKSSKKPKVAKTEPIETPPEGKIEEIPDLDIVRMPDEEIEKRRRLKRRQLETSSRVE